LSDFFCTIAKTICSPQGCHSVGIVQRRKTPQGHQVRQVFLCHGLADILEVAGAAALEQKIVCDPPPDDVASQNAVLHQQLKIHHQTISHLQETARITQSRAKDLELQNQALVERCEDAESILFRLRPQREQCTETEVKGDYESLKVSVMAWVNKNCEAFLDNEQLGCDMIGDDASKMHGQVSDYDIILQKFRSQSNRWEDAKYELLIAIIMQYVFERILSRSYPLGLLQEEEALLNKIEKSMESLKPRRGKSLNFEAELYS
jgi:hypothetical protein